MQFKVIHSNSPLIIGLKSYEELSLLKRLSNINVNRDSYTESADCFGGIGWLKREYKNQLKPDAEPVIHAARSVPIALKIS